jgi:hypothetical protein
MPPVAPPLAALPPEAVVPPDVALPPVPTAPPALVTPPPPTTPPLPGLPPDLVTEALLPEHAPEGSASAAEKPANTARRIEF